jgi:hypothetical protein
MPEFWKKDATVQQQQDPPASPQAPPASGPVLRPVLSVPDDPLNTRNTVAGIGEKVANVENVSHDNAYQDRQARLNFAQTLRTEFNQKPALAAYQTVLQSTAAALNAEATPTGDQQLITAYAKALDPNSVVREGEFDTVANADSAVGRMWAKIQKEGGFDGAGLLRPEVRDRVKRALLNLADTGAQTYQQQRGYYGEIAKRNGIDPFEVVGPDIAKPFAKTLDEFRKQLQPQGQANDPTNKDIYANGLRWGDQPDDGSFDRDAYLREHFGVDSAKEDLIVGFWNANRGNQNLTPEAVKQWYQGQHLAAPTDSDLEKGIAAARQGKGFAGFDTSAAEKAYHDQLDRVNAQQGVDAKGAGHAVVANAAEGATLNLGDEIGGLEGAAGALLHGENPIGAYQVNRDLIRRELEQAHQAHPMLSTVGEIGGGLITAPLAFSDATTMAHAIRAGATLGAVTGFGSGEGAADSLRQAGIGAVIGGGIGAAGQSASAWLGTRAAARAATREGTQSAAKAGASDFTISGSAPQSGGTPVAPLSDAEQTEIAALARKATGRGFSAARARRTLAQRAAANPEAKGAAERLGVQLPADVLSDSAQVQSLTGLARSQVGSEAETAWNATASQTARRADEALAELGASPDLAQVSDDVLRRLDGTATALQQQASSLRQEVTAAIVPSERVEASHLQQVLAGLIEDYGGLAEARAAMTPHERSLLTMLGEGEEAIRPTYARLNRLRDDIGEALSKNKGPWADVNRNQLGEYYRALADDQLAAVEQMGGTELAAKQKAANDLFTQMYAQREEMQDLFGKQLDKSLAPLMRRALNGGAKGDAKDITLLLSRVPEADRGPAMLSAIMAQARTSAAHGGFSFANFTKLYRGLRQNSPIYAMIAKSVGPEAERVLTDLYAVSSRMADAETRVLRTGKANQVLSSAIQAQNLIGGILASTGRKAATGAAAAAGGVVAGPGGAAAGASLAEGIQRGLAGAGKSRLDKVHNLLSSPQFRELIDRIGNGGDAAGGLGAVFNSPAFHQVAKAAGYVTPEARRAWLTRLVSAESVGVSSGTGLPGRVAGAFNDNVSSVTRSAASGDGTDPNRDQQN